ncbi:MAG: MaoC family dehydratase [Thermodesulfobacteriota bacterium]
MDIELGYSYSQLKIGMKASLSKTVSESDVYLFAGVTGDFNPMHVNEEYAKSTRFGSRIAHGSLVEGFMAPVLGTKLPGLGTVALEKQARFVAPTYFGDTITATAEVSEKLEDKKWVRLKCTWTNQRGETVAFGTALVMPPPER